MDYALLKQVHIATVWVTAGLFVLRGIWMLRSSPRLEAAWARRLPHVNDTLLLAAGIGMLAAGGLNPLQQPWLLAKISGLLAYIGLGSLALKRGKTRRGRILAFCAALAMLAYIVAVAISKQCLPGIL
jgi:uncharacterized membrane protein SirB2